MLGVASNANALAITVLINGMLYSNTGSSEWNYTMNYTVAGGANAAFMAEENTLYTQPWIPALICSSFNASLQMASFISSNCSGAMTTASVALRHRVKMRSVVGVVLAAVGNYDFTVAGKTFIGPRDLPPNVSSRWAVNNLIPFSWQTFDEYEVEIPWGTTDIIVTVHLSSSLFSNSAPSPLIASALSALFTIDNNVLVNSSSNNSLWSVRSTFPSDTPLYSIDSNDQPYTVAPWNSATQCTDAATLAYLQPTSTDMMSFARSRFYNYNPSMSLNWYGFSDSACHQTINTTDLWFRSHLRLNYTAIRPF